MAITPQNSVAWTTNDVDDSTIAVRKTNTAGRVSPQLLEATVQQYLLDNPGLVSGLTNEQLQTAVTAYLDANPIPKVMAKDGSPAVAPSTSNDLYVDSETGDLYTGGS